MMPTQSPPIVKLLNKTLSKRLHDFAPACVWIETGQRAEVKPKVWHVAVHQNLLLIRNKFYSCRTSMIHFITNIISRIKIFVFLEMDSNTNVFWSWIYTQVVLWGIIYTVYLYSSKKTALSLSTKCHFLLIKPIILHIWFCHLGRKWRKIWHLKASSNLTEVQTLLHSFKSYLLET